MRKEYRKWRRSTHENVPLQTILKLFKETGYKSAPSKFERFSKVLASWSQILMLIAIVGGYFYTVVPVFQKEKMAEEISKLKIEKGRREKEIQGHEGELLTLNETKNELNRDVKEIRARNKRALIEIEKQVYEQQKLQMLGKVPLGVEFIYLFNKLSPASVFYGNYEKSIAEGLKKSFMQPLVLAEKKVLELEDNIVKENSQAIKSAQIRLLAEFKKGLHDNVTLLQCPEPDYQAWEVAYDGAKHIDESVIDKCVGLYFDKRIKMEGWKKNRVKRLQGTKFWREQSEMYSSTCRASLEVDIRSIFIKKWEDAYKPCDERLKNLTDVALNEMNLSLLLPFRDMTPPTHSQVSKLLYVKVMEESY